MVWGQIIYVKWGQIQAIWGQIHVIWGQIRVIWGQIRKVFGFNLDGGDKFDRFLSLI